MIGIEEYRNIVSDLMDELPEEFFRDLSGGVIVSEASALADYAVRNDVYLMGEYLVYSGIRQIVLFKGSFDRVYPLADADEAKRILRGVLRHEFRHHLESLGGVHNSSSLEGRAEEGGVSRTIPKAGKREPDPAEKRRMKP